MARVLGKVQETQVIVFSPRLKGGKTCIKVLDPGTSVALLTYLHALYRCAGYLKHLPKNGGFDLFSNLLFEYLSCE